MVLRDDVDRRTADHAQDHGENVGLLVVEHAKVGRRGGGRIEGVHAPDEPAHADEPMAGEVLEVLVQADLKDHALAMKLA